MARLFTISWSNDIPLGDFRKDMDQLCLYLGVFLRKINDQIPEAQSPDTGFQSWNKKQTIGLYFCDDTEMRKIHRKFRKIDKTTDILSFPAHEGLSIHGSRESLGDLVVSIDTILRSAKRQKKQWRWEASEVLIHGVLHLLGFDHIGNKKKAARMKSLQLELLRSFKKKLKGQTIN
jgi:probable rRNA maturation factor